MVTLVDQYFLQKEEPVKGYLLFLRKYILEMDSKLNETWKYGMPFYYYVDKMYCYLWVDKKLNQPYLGIVRGNQINHPDLIQGTRTRMKILMLDAKKDVPIKKIFTILQSALLLYTN